ncbi:ComF family protein, partial [Desertihabitans aurantiacus]|uniref:ComF family protein n=1 Tax=Desertihabitans aurantiacus TaxID=2282477 RepID=UPI0038B86127
MRTWVDAAADLVLGAQCPGCGTAGLGCCAACRAELEGGRLQRWHPRHGTEEEVVLAAGGYAGATRQLLTAYKERQAWWLAPLLGRRLALAV